MNLYICEADEYKNNMKLVLLGLSSSVEIKTQECHQQKFRFTELVEIIILIPMS